jgi:diguanylate cyclase (GGDEF)-like protein/putative nucleotidyltransferase with HDIG domain
MLLAGMWVLGLIALGAVIQFEREADASRRAQVVIAQLKNEEGSVLAVAFDAATTKAAAVPGGEQAARMETAKKVFSNSVATLQGLGQSGAPTRIETLSRGYFQLVDRLSALVAHGKSGQAALELGGSQRPDGIRGRLDAEFDRADADYGAAAAQSRRVALVATVVATVFLLIAFSIALAFSVRARRRSHREAMTDVLTGLGNRRKLFVDMEGRVAALGGEQTVSIGIFDLDGFKAYNDTFGHPAGDALLARLGGRLADAVGERGSAYRIGGDEFVVVTGAADGESLLALAQVALSEKGDRFSIGCSLGSTRILAGITLEEALRAADQRLYTNKRSARAADQLYTDKRSARAGLPSGARDALLQVLTEQNANLVTHLGHVAELAESTANSLGLPADLVELTRLAAELHDVGKAAIPASILDKPGPLDAAERTFIERHSAIGERIVAAAPALEAIAPIVRSAHERVDGTGYPDGLRLEQIPIPSRIIAVVDAFDAMTRGRPYQPAIPAADALAELRRNAGTQFDPAVVEAFAIALGKRLTTPRAA